MTTVTKQHVDEIRALHSPPVLVKDTCEAIFLILGYSSTEANSWKLVRKVLQKPTTAPDSLLNQLKHFHPDKCNPASVKKAKVLLRDVTMEQAKNVSLATSHLVAWALKSITDCESAGKCEDPS